MCLQQKNAFLDLQISSYKQRENNQKEKKD
jgi:hypothetical protein